jgi:membrane-bound serine protease (ClpP class)
MVEVGVALVLFGAALMVAEAHVPSGLLGVAGAVVFVTGVGLASAGGGVAVVLIAAVAALAVSGLWMAVALRKSLAAGRLRAASGREALSGRTGVVRSWAGEAGQVFVDGALWRARLSFAEDGDQLRAGDAVVVERVNGLTLGVRRAEEWEDGW